jgi:hypothetical protein
MKTVIRIFSMDGAGEERAASILLVVHDQLDTVVRKDHGGHETGPGEGGTRFNEGSCSRG